MYNGEFGKKPNFILEFWEIDREFERDFGEIDKWGRAKYTQDILDL